MANLITIDQLLESVDLDFEPRFVTKDPSGAIAIWAEKPERTAQHRVWIGQTDFVVIHLIKLAEFENKDWQECIYEVPKKVDYTKWIGKLCWFWDEEFNTKNIVGFLTHVNLEAQLPFCINNSDYWEHCEPVRPDDDVIYKDAVNELKGAKNE